MTFDYDEQDESQHFESDMCEVFGKILHERYHITLD